MNGLSKGQFRALSDFFNTVAAAWFTGGIITPFFSGIPSVEKIQFSIAGVVNAYVFLNFSLYFAGRIK